VPIDAPADIGGGSSDLASNDDAPWHDPSMAIGDRMKLAEGKPVAPRLMAAMAQQDCGQCGYNCADYANALALKSEERLNLCVPGGKDTMRMLKSLAAEIGVAPATSAARSETALASQTEPAAPGRSREAPVEVTFLSRRRLNAEGSEKATFHVEFDLAEAGLDYVVGDAFGLFPTNELGLVDQIIAMLGASHVTEVRGRPLRDVLTEDVSLSPPRIRCSSSCPSSPAASSARRRARSRPAKTPTAMQRPSTCSPFSRSLLACGRTPRPSSRPWNRSSPGSIRSPRR
jgi:sulfite reductase (NADPH) flavoprotein alpha-component